MADHGFDSAAYAAASCNLPPGWDCKYDARTGRYYYINYFTKTTTWEDPRLRYRPVAQPPPQFFQSNNANSTAAESIPLQDLTNVRPSPIPNRAYTAGPQQYTASSPSRTPASSQASTTQETSLTSETDQAVAKISAMFPTAAETHIRTLLKKYHNREAVVMSALQVEKHPITTPGPYATPPTMGRHTSSALPFGLYSAYQQMMANSPPIRRCSPPRSPTPRPGSGASSSGSYGSPRPGESGYRSSPRPHSSPKMKLRYMKSVFPAVEETLLLDILSNADNNVQKATERLVTMGFEKRDTPPPRLTQRRREEEQKALEKQKLASVVPTPPPRMKSLEEKQKMKKRLQDQYPEIPERVVTIALDSSDFDEDRAAHILQVMVQEETKPSSVDASTSSSKEGMYNDVKSQGTCDAGVPHGMSPSHIKGSPARKSGDKEKTPTHRRSKGKKEVPKVSRGTSTTEDKEYKSPYLQHTTGPNAELHNGPNDQILLVDYVTWNGPNCEIRQGPRKILAKGPDPTLREPKSCLAKGPNKDLVNGPVKGLAKGSVYASLALCNTESRGNGLLSKSSFNEIPMIQEKPAIISAL